MWARLVVRGCWAVQAAVLPGRTLYWAADTGILPWRTLCGRCLASFGPAVGGSLASLTPAVGGGVVTPAVMSQPRPVHTSSVPPKARWKKKFRKKKRKEETLDELPLEDADEEEALDVTSLEEERDRIIHLVQERLKTNRRKHFSGTQHYRPNIVRVVDALQAQRFPSNLIIDIASDTDLLERPIAHVAGFVEKFRLERFPNQLIASIVTSNPRVVTLQEPEIDLLLNALRATLNSKLIQDVVGGNPEVLLMDPKKIISRFQKLTQLFHRSEVVQLAGRNPTLLTCGWSEVEEKYWYVTEVMGIDAGQMVKTNVMTHSLQHIQTRHTFLERAGLYERPNKHGATSIQNATLRQIVDLDDDHFAPLCSGMTAREYRTYWRLVELERLEEGEEEELEEEEEDTESLDMNAENR